MFIKYGAPTETTEWGHINLTLMGIGENTNKNITLSNVYEVFFYESHYSMYICNNTVNIY